MSVSISGKLKRRSDRALLIDLENGNDAQWIPISQIEDFDDGTFDAPLGSSIDLEISDWIAQQKNIRPVNLDRFTVERCEDAVMEFTVLDSTNGTEYFCWCKNRRAADMIAAALNLTQGKV